MSMDLEVRSRPAPGLAVIDSYSFGESYIGQLWASCKARKPGKCDYSGRNYAPGAIVYRPVGNVANRMRRVLADVVDLHEGIARATEGTSETRGDDHA